MWKLSGAFKKVNPELILVIFIIVLFLSRLGNPVADLLLKFFSDETTGKLNIADISNDDTLYYIEYSYAVNNRNRTKSRIESQAEDIECFFEVFESKQPCEILISYVYFAPDISSPSEIVKTEYFISWWRILVALLMYGYLVFLIFKMIYQAFKNDKSFIK